MNVDKLTVKSLNKADQSNTVASVNFIREDGSELNLPASRISDPIDTLVPGTILVVDKDTVDSDGVVALITTINPVDLKKSNEVAKPALSGRSRGCIDNKETFSILG